MLISPVSAQAARLVQAKARPQAEIQFGGLSAGQTAKTVGTKVGMAAGAGLAAKFLIGMFLFLPWGKSYVEEGAGLATAAAVGMAIQKYGSKKKEDEAPAATEEK